MLAKTKKKPAAKRAKTDTTAAELPQWVTDTPGVYYQLEMSTEHDGNVQTIDITLDEYWALKEHLAKLRGYTIPAEAAHA